MEQWTRLNEWAAAVPETFVRDNEGLTLEKHSNTDLDQYFALSWRFPEGQCPV